MRSQQITVRQIEGVVHGSSRVVPWKIQCFEIMVIVFDLWAGFDAEAELGKDRQNAIKCAAHRMSATRLDGSTRQRHVDSFGGKSPGQFVGPKRFLTLADGLLERLLGPIDGLTDLPALLMR